MGNIMAPQAEPLAVPRAVSPVVPIVVVWVLNIFLVVAFFTGVVLLAPADGFCFETAKKTFLIAFVVANDYLNAITGSTHGIPTNGHLLLTQLPVLPPIKSSCHFFTLIAIPVIGRILCQRYQLLVEYENYRKHCATAAIFYIVWSMACTDPAATAAGLAAGMVFFFQVYVRDALPLPSPPAMVVRQWLRVPIMVAPMAIVHVLAVTTGGLEETKGSTRNNAVLVIYVTSLMISFAMAILEFYIAVATAQAIKMVMMVSTAQMGVMVVRYLAGHC